MGSESHVEANLNSEPGPQRDLEIVSALADGELDRSAARFVVRRLGSDASLQALWQRIHLQRACINGELTGTVSLVRRVSDALEFEDDGGASLSRPSGWLRAGLGGAVAAGVAIVAVIGLGQRIDSDGEPGPATKSGPGFVSQTNALDRQFSLQAMPTSLGGPDAGESGSVEHSPSSEWRTRQRINRYVIRPERNGDHQGRIPLFTSPVLTAPSTTTIVRTPEPGSGPGGEPGDPAADQR